MPKIHRNLMVQMSSATQFTPYMSLIGGILIGLAAVGLMALHGRIAGMTGILSGVIPPLAADWTWRGSFLIGAIAAPVVFTWLGGSIDFAIPVSTIALVAGGLIVGLGVTFGSGCASGHGVCGMARLSPRSIVATLIFMLTAFLTVYIVRHVIGG
jgi:uncharacterized membrane protein YedE/YeeE